MPSQSGKQYSVSPSQFTVMHGSATHCGLPLVQIAPDDPLSCRDLDADTLATLAKGLGVEAASLVDGTALASLVGPAPAAEEPAAEEPAAEEPAAEEESRPTRKGQK